MGTTSGRFDWREIRLAIEAAGFTAQSIDPLINLINAAIQVCSSHSPYKGRRIRLTG
jgi:hypothetical protein